MPESVGLNVETAGETAAETTEQMSAETDSVMADAGGSATEFTEKSGAKSSPEALAAGPSDPTVIQGDLNSIPWSSLDDKKVVVDGDLVVVDTYDLVRRGQVKLARKRLFIPTSYLDPNDADPRGNSFDGGSNVAEVVRAQKYNDTATLTLDDGSTKQNIFPPKLFPQLGEQIKTIRVGSKVSNVSGKVSRVDGKWVLVPDAPVDFEPAERPKRPSVGDADITLASFNVLNYFTTLDDGQNNARGADSASEFQRQEAKIVAAITGLQADVIGLMELENNLEAEAALVKALNKSQGDEVYAACGLPDGFAESPGGGDSIRVGMIYRKDRVQPLGNVNMIKDPAFDVARTPIVQAFRSVDGGAPFTVIVNHFKSKGGADNADETNKNKGDGQAAYNAARREQSMAIGDYVDQMLAKTPDARIVVIGDLNAYQQEDPIDVLRDKGLVDLHEWNRLQTRDIGDLVGPAEYSFVYYGQCGSLDHALATPAFVEDLTGVATWHINADEPRFIDYNEEYNPPALYQADPFRSADHDPVLIGIRKE
ncbi:MAG: ExeM/NucH family extracellular endonuclease [Planctomycetota bacterium]